MSSVMTGQRTGSDGSPQPKIFFGAKHVLRITDDHMPLKSLLNYLPYPRLSPRCDNRVSSIARYQGLNGIFRQFDGVAPCCNSKSTSRKPF